ncbi:hypothetical protein UP09_22550 [Bradyrhizobium sp. LTSP885]|uniref:hypothetical protein n=1 Tax=Bradyrhizobium sp. LTSP885 TaxID=1619232 RepID=UPI0005C88CC0|nr:hypothetical protein [Bradyrhizobium sp. LTSP885]KJC40289.1 hypothetical protein UP09_22550 [Bradyrhizobium sp. LTSP885]
MLTSTFSNTNGVLAAGVGAVICPAPSAPVSQLTISNVGANGMTIRYGAAPADPLDGQSVAPGAVVTLTGEAISQSDALYAVSVAGTSYRISIGAALEPRA